MTSALLDSTSDAHAVPEVELRSVSKRFGETQALDRVDLTIAPREVRALVGHNGSGKSTLIKILAGYYTADPGSEIVIAGTAVDSGKPVPRDLNLRFVHQGLGLINEMSAVDNIALAGGYRVASTGRIRWREQDDLAHQLLARVGLAIDVRKPVGECGAVERTGIAIARAIAGAKPGGGLLVLDEPSVALSPNDTERLFGVVRNLVDIGMSILYVSHYLDEVFAIADRVTVLRDGRVVADRPTASLDKSALVELMVGKALESTFESTPETANRAGAPALRARGLTGVDMRGVDIDVWPGEIVGVAGTSGSGRTELPTALVGATQVAGEIHFSGAPVRGGLHPSRMRDLGVALVPADRHRQGSHPDMTVTENMELADMRPLRTSWGWLSKSRENAFTQRWISGLDIRPPNAQTTFAHLSGGNQQKVVLAKWLAGGPNVLVLDEPTSGVDIAARAAIYELLRERAQAGLALLVCSSDVDELVEICDRIVVLRRGRVVAELHAPGISEVDVLHAMETDSPVSIEESS